jgi:hypothetical protein
MQRKELTPNSHEIPQLRAVLGTNWARDEVTVRFGLESNSSMKRASKPAKLFQRIDTRQGSRSEIRDDWLCCVRHDFVEPRVR